MTNARATEATTAVTLESTLIAADDVLYRNLDGEAVLVHLASGSCFELDAIGTKVWERIGRGETVSEVLEGLLPDYAVDRAVAERELLEFVNDLAARGLVRAR